MNEFYELSDGFNIPKLGFGTYKLKGTYGTRVIEQALQVGYRLLDTAVNYENEGTVGRAIKNSSVPRDQITVTSKLPGRHHSYQEALAAIEESVACLDLDYIDLYLIHWPNPKQEKYVEAWQALIDAQKSGLVRSIGVSNFLPEHIEHLEKETGVLPVINQVELHPEFNQQAQREFDASKEIITQAWSPLGRASKILQNETIKKIADKYGKSIPQIILRWQIQLNVLPIPKASHHLRQLNNFAIFDFELSKEDMTTMNALTKENGRLTGQDPAEHEEF
ncbi:aldo/keto reductase [Tetragenococcus koreensis]|uniref:2,5-diketo-D-gluconic acid reductase n=1 Tax=Tetragenococcus koreensis TaxID=290335 RepID=A0AAN4ZRV6_9ENTE|nr:aldo/keto reductase [Tetragenococcus koreensis]AYW46409.1 2,5-diketo-D-gluconic acid reductase [Tetragenococcus koreensis]MCF1584817.1 aldo/keto reductase [Tetragenococcus koreensis]MCF1614578.1 aldo/keto reductase [Tetragenococcus koreensis]MCF1616703.1 aldo/keto reductase [Tetragenococcus koreensis]MCF1619964.1 aldo/keto reductase [Tetragenococcus koreensis]